MTSASSGLLGHRLMKLLGRDLLALNACRVLVACRPADQVQHLDQHLHLVLDLLQFAEVLLGVVERRVGSIPLDELAELD